MDRISKFAAASMPPLPPSLAAVFQAALGGGAKRERTQVQLVQAAVRVFAERGVPAATVQEVAQVAGVTAGTFYNHFRTKDELLARVALVLADSLSHAINGSYAQVKDGAERMAIGQRRYVWLAAQSPQWALLLLDVLAARPSEFEAIQGYVLADLRLGLKQKRFKVASEAAALDAIAGTCTFAMRRVALGLAPANHDIATATTVLRALGMAQDEAAAVARRPLPELGTGST